MIRNSLCSLMIVAIASATALSDDATPKVKIRKLAKPVKVWREET